MIGSRAQTQADLLDLEELPPCPLPLTFYITLAGFLSIAAVALLTDITQDRYDTDSATVWTQYVIPFRTLGAISVIVGFGAVATGLHKRKSFIVKMEDFGLDIAATISSVRKFYELEAAVNDTDRRDMQAQMVDLQADLLKQTESIDLAGSPLSIRVQPDWVVEDSEESESLSGESNVPFSRSRPDAPDEVQNVLRTAAEKVIEIEHCLIDTGAYREGRRLGEARRSALGVGG
ncbi:hypothetical protein [Streptomyces sp. NPDC005407]|uniref:hypothetical protein n=1 Tax=Streptomyces sp. NPDC005407 TaxID=3155340 RepID=UPI0033AB514B